MGLLDEEFYDDPQRMALMRFGTGLLAGGGANSRALAQGLGGMVEGGLADRKAKQRALEEAQQREFRALQMRQMQGEMDGAQAMQQRNQRIGQRLIGPSGESGAPGGATGTPQGPAGNMVMDNLKNLFAAQRDEGDLPGAMATLKQLQEASKISESKSFMVDGKPRRMSMNAQGQWGAPSEFEEAHELKFLNNGQTHEGVSAFTGQSQVSMPILQSPDSQATERASKARVGLGYSQIKAAKDRAAMAGAGGGDAMLPDDVAEQMAEQAMAGDTSVFQNLGRGAQGAANIIKVRSLMARKTAEAGENGSDRAAKNAEYFGTKAGQRSAGTRIANVEMAVSEAQELVPLAREASAAVARSGFLPFGKAQMFVDNKTNSPEMRQFVAANNAMVNVYSRAISPTGQPTVSDKEHARELLQTAYDNKSYQAVLDQMNLEMEAARKAPKTVRREFSEAVTGRHGPATPKAAAPMAALPAPNASNKGKIARDTESGKRYQNKTGMKWEEI